MCVCACELMTKRHVFVHLTTRCTYTRFILIIELFGHDFDLEIIQILNFFFPTLHCNATPSLDMQLPVTEYERRKRSEVKKWRKQIKKKSRAERKWTWELISGPEIMTWPDQLQCVVLLQIISSSFFFSRIFLSTNYTFIFLLLLF